MIGSIKRLAVCALLLASATFAAAQSVNDGFNPNANDGVQSVAVQVDGKALVGGNFTSIGGQLRARIARLNADGSLDTTFDPAVGANDSVASVVVQADGKVLIGGDFTQVGGQPRNHIARLNANGSVDTTFDPGSGADDSVTRVALQPDGKVLVGGAFTSINAQVLDHIARLNADGSIDTGFNPAGGADDAVHTFAVQADGKVLVGGGFTRIDGKPRHRIARLNADGSVDASFDAGVGPDNAVTSLALQPDGKVLIGGWFTSINDLPYNRIARLNADGSLDTGFNSGGGANDLVWTLALQPDGKVLVGGGFTQIGGQARNRVARLNVDGSVDASYYPTGGSDGMVTALAVQADGDVLLGGTFSQIGGQARGRIARLNIDGSVDANLSLAMTGTGVSSFAEQPDGKLILGGIFSITGASRTNFARLNADGAVDTSYIPASPNGSVTNVTVLPDGKVLLAGAFTKIGTVTRNRIARLNIDGSLDTSFDPGNTTNDDINTVAVQPDGAIVVGGFFTSFGGVTRNYLVRLNSNGTVDPTFNPDADGYVSTLAPRPDGTFVIGGYFGKIGSTARANIAQIKADGTLDTTYYPASGASSIVYNLLTQPDGKLLAGGFFTKIGGTTRNLFARLNTDATADSFYPTGGLTGDYPMSIAQQTNGNVVLVGSFTKVGTTARNRIARLAAADGSLDATYYPTSGANNIVTAVMAQTNGKLLVGGFFTQVGGVARTRIARLSVPEASIQRLDVGADRTRVQWLRSGSGPELQRVWFERSDDGIIWSALGDGAYGAGGWSLGGLTLPRNQNLWVRARGEVRGGLYNASTSLIESVRQVYLRTFTVTASVVGQGTVTVTPATVEPGAAAVLTVTPGADGPLVSLIGDTCTPTDNGDGTWTASNITADCIVTATFGLASWTLTYAAGIHGTLSGTALQTVAQGADGTPVMAVPDTGYHFVEWSDGSTATPRTDTNVAANISVTASFAINTYTVTATGGSNGTITPPTQTVEHGAAAGFTVTPSANYHVATVSGDICTPVHGSGNSWSAPNITSACAVTATFAIDTWTVTASAGANGTITPPSRTVSHGATTTFTVAPATGYHASVTGCGGSLSDTTYTTAVVTADCAVSASFASNTYAVTATAGANGTITPPTQTVDHGTAANFTVTPTASHHVVSVNGDTCTPVHGSGNSWSAPNITSACAVTATFAIDTWTVTASAGANGAITPATQSVDHGNSATVTVTPAAGYHVAGVDGDVCTMTHTSGSTWISTAITANCAIAATFAADPADLALTIDDGRAYARYGQLLTYAVTLRNRGTGAANAVSIAMDVPPQIDAEYNRWICLGAGAGATCSDTGEGALQDDNVTIPAGRSLTWLVTAQVRLDAAGDGIDAQVSASDGTHHPSASDHTTLVILRDGFDVPYGDGAQDAPTDLTRSCPSDSATEAIDGAFLRSFTLPPPFGLFDTVLVARGNDGARFRLERVTLGGAHLRLVTTAPNGAEQASPWAQVEQGATLTLATVSATDGQRMLLLEGAASSLSAPLPAGMANGLRIQTQEMQDGGCD